jgi:polysaccharide transporter, PST family
VATVRPLKKFPSLSATSWLTTKTVFSQVFAILLFAIQAPLLGPRAFGLISIVLVFVTFCELVLGEASSEALISIREIDDAHFDTMNTVIFALSLAFGLAVFFGAHAAAHLLGDPEFVPLLHWMAILPVVSAMGAVPQAATKRAMEFQPLALRSILSLVVGGVVGLILTLAHYGAWALAWQALVTRLVSTVVLWMAIPLKFRFGFSRSRLADLAKFALPTLLSRLLNWATSQFPRLVFGLYWGPTELGLFGLASRLCDILVEVGLMPRYVVARLELRRFASDPAGLSGTLAEALTSTTVILFPLCVGGAAVAPTLFHAWLDARWLGGIVPAEMLILMCAPFVTHYLAGAALLAMNFQAAEAMISIAQMLLTLAVVFVFGPFGINIATAAFAARPLVLMPLPMMLLKKKCAVSPRKLLRSQRPAFIAACTMGAVVTGLRLGLEPMVASVILLPLLIVAGAAIYASMIAVMLPQMAARYLKASPFSRGQ